MKKYILTVALALSVAGVAGAYAAADDPLTLYTHHADGTVTETKIRPGDPLPASCARAEAGARDGEVAPCPPELE